MVSQNRDGRSMRRVKLKFALSAYKILQEEGLADEFARRVADSKARLVSVLTQANRLGLDTSSISTSSVLPRTVSKGLQTMIDRGFEDALQDNDKARLAVDPAWVTQFIAISRENNLRSRHAFAAHADDNCDRPNPYDCPDK